MTERTAEEWGRGAVACKGWRWMPGMLLRQGGWSERVGSGWEWDDSKGEILPDLSDPATRGCLLALVREAWGDETVCTAATREADGVRGWVMDAWVPLSPVNEIGPYPTEAEALVAALEAAEGREVSDDLSKRAVSLPGFRWMPGMLTVTGYRLVRPLHGMWRITQHAPENHLDCVDPARHNFVPDPDDPATAGCLLALLGPGVRVWMDGADGLWTVEVGRVRASMHSTLNRACIAAAETARAWPGGEP